MRNVMREQPLVLQTDVDDGTRIVRCAGTLTSNVASQLSAEVKPLIPTARKIVLDLTGVTFMDSMGLGTIASLYVSCRTSGCQFQVINLSTRVRDLFTVTHLLSLFEACGESNIAIR